MNTRNSIFQISILMVRLTGIFCGMIIPCVGLAIGTWQPVTHTAPGKVQLMLLLSDGTILAIPPTGDACYKLTPDNRGSYINGNWTTLPAMHYTREFFSSQLLRDGRVFVA